MPTGMYNSVEDVITRYRLIKSEFTRWLVLTHAYKDMYQGNHWISQVEEGDYQATLPIEALVIDTALALITSNSPLLTVVPDDENSDRQQSLADKVEKWHMGVDYLNDQYEGGDPRKAALYNGLLYGLGWIREVADFPEDWDDIDRDPERLTFIQTSIHPQQVYFKLGRVPGGIRTLGYESQYTVQDIESEWGVTLKLRQDEKGRFMAKDFYEERLLVDFWEWQTRRGKNTLYHSVFVADPPQYVKVPTPMDEYRRIPYYPVACYETGEQKPEERFLSFLFKLKELPHLTEIVVSRELRMAEMYIDPIILIKNSSGESIPFIKAPGAVVEMTPEDDMKYLTYTGTAPDLPRVRELLLNLTQLSSFADPILRSSNADSQLGKAMDIDQGMFKITEPVKHFKQALEQMYFHRAMLARAFSPDSTIPIHGDDVHGKGFMVKLTGKQLAKTPHVNVRIKPQMRDQLLADINIATQAVNANLWSKDAAMDFLGVQDKAVMREAIKRDLIEFSEEALALEKQLYLKDLQEEVGDQQPEQAPGGGMGLPPVPFGQDAAAAGAGMQPGVQGAGNGVQNANMPGAAANPANPVDLMARRVQQASRGGRPVDQRTVGGR